jgi:hypothetical protein
MRHVTAAMALLLSFLTANAASDTRRIAIEAVKKVSAVCAGCSFYALPAKSKFIRKHSIFFVSTLDRIPPPFWSVAISRKNETAILDHKNIEEWNAVITSEHLSLKTSAEAEDYAREFVEFCVGKAVYLQTLASQQVGDELQMKFSTKDIEGKVHTWFLLFTKKGKVLRFEEKKS